MLEKVTGIRTFASGFGDDSQLTVSMEGDDENVLQIWDGFLSDILEVPMQPEVLWKGFTRDYHQHTGAFVGKGKTVTVDAQEYLEDIMRYGPRYFEFAETEEVLEALQELLEYAASHSKPVILSLKR